MKKKTSDYERDMQIIDKYQVQCSCGRKVLMRNTERTICTWCGKWIYKSPKIRFRYEMKEKLYKQKCNK